MGGGEDDVRVRISRHEDVNVMNVTREMSILKIANAVLGNQICTPPNNLSNFKISQPIPVIPDLHQLFTV